MSVTKMCVQEYILASANMAYVIENRLILKYSANMKYIELYFIQSFFS